MVSMHWQKMLSGKVTGAVVKEKTRCDELTFQAFQGCKVVVS